MLKCNHTNLLGNIQEIAKSRNDPIIGLNELVFIVFVSLIHEVLPLSDKGYLYRCGLINVATKDQR